MVMVAAVLLVVLMMKMTTTMMMFSMMSNMIRLSTQHNNETTGAGERVPPQAHPKAINCHEDFVPNTPEPGDNGHFPTRTLP